MKVLVTGGAGFVGFHTSKLLLKSGYKVTILDNFNSYYPVELKELNAKSLKKLGARVIKKDLAEDDLAGVTSGFDYVIHFAAQPGISNSVSFLDYEKNNIVATEKLLKSLDGDATLKLFINVATSSIYGYFADSLESVAARPASYYGVTKLAAEQLVMYRHRAFDFPATSFRLFSVTGSRDRPHDKLFTKLIRATLENTDPVKIFAGSREHKRSYTPAKDIANAFLLGIRNKDKCVGEVFNIGTDEVVTTEKALEYLQEIIGKPLNMIDVESTRVGDQKITAANSKKAKGVLGWESKTPLKEALLEAVDWYKSDILGKIKLDL